MSITVRNTLQAMVDAIRIEMHRDETVIYIGEGTGERGGSFGQTLGLFQEFPGRMIDVPISELGFTGMCVGAAASGCRPIADLMFSDFLAEAMSQIVNQAAKLRYMSNGQVSVPMVIWASIGALKSAGPHHSGSLYPWFMHVPGLKIVIPSNPADAKGLLAAAIRDDDPVLFMIHKLLLSKKGDVPDGEHVVPIGKAAFVREGKDVTIVTTALMTHLAVEAAEKLAPHGVQCEIIDLRSVAPLDQETILQSLAKTGRLLVVDEAYGNCGLGAEVAARVMESGFDLLDAPVLRVNTAFVSHPFSPAFDPMVLPQVQQIVEKVQLLLDGGPILEYPSRPTHTLGISFDPSLKPSEPAMRDQPREAFQGTQRQSQGSPNHQNRAEITMPNLGLTVTEATINRWSVQVGEPFKKGQGLFEIETDKATLEVEAEADGILEEILAPHGTTLPLGEIVAYYRPL